MIMAKSKIFLMLILAAIALILLVIFLPSRKINAPTQPIAGIECRFQNCHGLDMVCTENPPEFCTEEYQLGDACRRYASCRSADGKCQLAEDEKFDRCKECVEKCNENKNPFQCESQCHLDINETPSPEPV